MSHIQQAVFEKLLHCGTVFRLTTGSFCNRNFIFWHDYGMNFCCFFVIILCWSCMNGNSVPDSEFHLFTVNHVESFELFIHLIDIPEWFPDKYCFTLWGFYSEFRLKYPRRILILIGTDLIVYQKKGYQTRVIGQLSGDRTLNEYLF